MPRKFHLIGVPADMLLLIDRVFLPKNASKMRKAHPMVVEAVREYKRYVADFVTSSDVESLSDWGREAAAVADATSPERR